MEKNFVAKISAIISNFERNVRKAQRLSKTAIPNEIETDITANTNKFQRAIQKAKAMAQKWRSHKVDVNANTTQFTRAVAFSKAKLATWRKHTVKLNFDTSGMTKAQIAMTTISKMAEEYQNKMDKLASNIRTFGTIFSQQVKGVMIASFQALIPIIAGIVPVIFAVLNAIKALSGGTVAFAGAGAIAFGGLLAYALMAKSAIKMLNDGTIQASSATRKYQSALKGVKDEWQGIIKQNATAIFQSMANGLNTVKTALSSLKPFFKGVADGVNQASKKMLEWAKNSQVAQKFFKMMNTTGVSVFNKLLSAAGRFGDGLINVFTQLAPLFQWSANWINRLGASFQKWANSAAGKNSIKQFMEYTKTNLPIIGNIFKNVFSGIFNLMKAFGSNSTSIFKYLEQMSAKFKAWSETIANSQGFKKFVEYMQKNGPVIMQLIGNIVRALVAFGVAMAPIASVLLRVITAIAGFVAKLFETHPAVAQVVGVIGVLAGIFWSLMAPVMAVATVLNNVFGLSLLSVAKHILDFIKNASLLRGILNLVKGAFTLLMSPIANIAKLLPILAGAFGAISAPVWIVIGAITALVGIIIWLWQTNEGFREAITNAWQVISETVGGAIQSVINWFVQLWNSVSTLLAPIIPLIQQFGTILGQILGVVAVAAINILIMAFQTLWTMVSIVWTAVGGIIMAAVQLIVGLFTALIQLLTGDFSGAWLTLKNTIGTVMQTIWGTIQQIWSLISNYIFSILGRITGQNITSWSQVFSIISDKLSQAWGAAQQWMGNILNTIVNSLVQVVANTIAKMVEFAQGVGNGVRNGWQAAMNFLGQFQQAGSDLIQGLIDGVVNMAGRLVSAVEGVVGNAIAAAKNLLNQHSPSKVFEEIGMYTMQGFINGINGQGGAVVKNMRHLMQDAVDAFKPNIGLDSSLTDGLDASMTGNVDSHMTKDVKHSMQENNRPIVNVQVRNEGDVDFIKSYIDDVNSRDSLMYT
ncbi:terminase [Staphylococcus saprophyticus]|nr:terminase [Staphylococcus saprophyticus]